MNANHLSLNAWPLTDEEVIQRDDETRLVQRAKIDREARGQLYRKHYPAIHRFVHRRVGNRHDADEIVSDVFLEMVRKLHQYQPRGVPFRAWLYRLAVTQVSRWARRNRKFAEQQLTDVTQHVQNREQHESQLDDELVEAVLSTLPPRLQAVLSLYYLAEMSIAEVAEVLNCRPGTVKSRLSRARELMRKRLSKKER